MKRHLPRRCTQNGGADGEHFLQRYFAIGWVVAVRWGGLLALAMIAHMTLLEAFGAASDSTTWHEVLLVAMGELVIYWRTGYHVRDVARRATGTG